MNKVVTIDDKKVSVIIPVWNEKENVEEVAMRTLNTLPNGKIIFVDDASIDGTAQLIKKLNNNHQNIKGIYFEKHRGKGESIREALKHATNDIIVLMDGDLQYNPEDITKLVNPIESGLADLVVANRNMDGNSNNVKERLSLRIILWFLIKLHKLRVSDPHAGFKAFSKKLVENATFTSSNNIDVELIFEAKRKGLKISEVPVRCVERKRGKSKVKILPIIKELLTLRYKK